MQQNIIMSVIFEHNGCYFLDHNDYISKVYEKVNTDECVQKYALSKKIFSIKSSKKGNRKRAFASGSIEREAATVKSMFDRFKKEIPEVLTDKMNDKYIFESNDVRAFSQQMFELLVFDHKSMIGGNNSEQPLKCKIKDNYFLIPQKCKFYSGCVKDQCEKLCGNKYDIVIADPPWWNKYIRRLKDANNKLSYSMMYNQDIAAIPVKNLLSDDCLIAVWCTNSPSNVAAVKSLIFPEWGVEYVATWYWLKVTLDLEPLCPFGLGSQKQPYERLLLGKLGNVKDIPDCQLIVSIPSALHSHKPPLLDLLTPYVKTESPHVLELFARYLLPNTTSVGYEPLKWQHISLYENIEEQL